jgi:hypothetical protein
MGFGLDRRTIFVERRDVDNLTAVLDELSTKLFSRDVALSEGK